MMRQPGMIYSDGPVDVRATGRLFFRLSWRHAVLIVLVGLALTAGAAILLPVVLIAEGQVVPSDVIVDLAMNPHSDSDFYIAQLYRAGVAPRILLVSSPIGADVYPSDYVRPHLVEMGVPASAVTILHLPLADCAAQNLPALVEHLQQRGWRRVQLVVPPLGSRLGQSVTARHFRERSIQFAMTYAPRDRDEYASGWWHTHWKAQAMIGVLFGYALDQLYPECR